MKKTITDTLTKKIKTGEVVMRSQLSIWTEKIGLNGSVIVLLVLLITIIGFVIYWINSNNDLLFGGYGKYGLASFFQSFPYIFVVVFILFFLFLIGIFRKFDFSYKRPFFVILFLILSGIMILGWISIKQPIGQRFYKQEGRMLRMGTMNNRNAVSGIVKDTNKNKIIIEDENKKQIIINLNKETHFPLGQPKIGDQIRSVGFWDGDIFTAIGVRLFDDNNPSTLGPGVRQGRGQGRGIWSH